MISVDLLIFDGVDELDFAGPYEVLSSCHKVINGKWSDKPAFHVQVVAEQHSTVRCAHGLNVLPDKPISRALGSDVVIVPGGPGARKELHSDVLREYLTRAHDASDVMASISTGTFMLGNAGLIDGRKVTTHYARCDELAKLFPDAHVQRGQRIVMDNSKGNLWSSGGISSGIDLALAIITKFEGKETACLAARRIEWPLPPVAL